MKKLSYIKKNPKDPHFWFIFRTGRTYSVSIGHPTDSRSRLVRRFSSKDALKEWMRYDMSEVVSLDHVYDLTGQGFVSPYYTQWYVDNILNP
jgi:hypothetical protein